MAVNSGIALGAAPDLAGQRVTWRQWYMAFLLTFLYIYAQIDRSALILLVTPIKQDLGVSDTQMSLILGGAFAAFYALLGLPAGYLVDRVSRRAIMGVGVVLWSLMTMASGFAQNYLQLFLGRCGVGIGEAAITPASYSLIRDSFPPEKRGRAFGIYSAGAYIGAALAVIISGALLGLANAGAFKNLPVIGAMRPWQAVLVCIGSVGIPISLLTLTFREPPRRVDGSIAQSGVTFREAFAQIQSHWSPYLLITAWVTCFFGVAISYGSWMPTIIGRTWALPPATIGMFFGGSLIVGAPIGAWFGGHAIDTLIRRGRRDAVELVGLWITIIFIPFGIAAPVAPEANEMWIALFAQLLVAGAYQPVGASFIARITPQRVMGKVTSIYLLVFNLLGLGLGPTMVAVISDNFYTGKQALGFALGTAAAVLMVIALFLMLALLRRARRLAAAPA